MCGTYGDLRGVGREEVRTVHNDAQQWLTPIIHLSARCCWFRPDYSGDWEAEERDIPDFPENKG